MRGCPTAGLLSIPTVPDQQFPTGSATLPGLCSLSVSVPLWVNSLHFRESPKALPCATLGSPWSLVLPSCCQDCTITGVTADGYLEVSCLWTTQDVSHFCPSLSQANFYLVSLCKRGIKDNQLSSCNLRFGKLRHNLAISKGQSLTDVGDIARTRNWLCLFFCYFLQKAERPPSSNLGLNIPDLQKP